MEAREHTQTHLKLLREKLDSDGLRSARMMIHSLHPSELARLLESLPLRESEIRALFSLICMRLCMSVCICAHQKSIEPDNEYLKISEKPAWELLEKLANVSSESASQMFLEACDMKP